MISGLQSPPMAQPRPTSQVRKPMVSAAVHNVRFGAREAEGETQQPKKRVGLLERLVNRIIQFIDELQKSVEEFFKMAAAHLASLQAAPVASESSDKDAPEFAKEQPKAGRTKQ